MLKMTVVFLVDTSASMNQRCANGLSILDCAKAAVEHFIKVRSREISWHRSDRYILVTCEGGPDCIKVVDRFPFANFLRALKSLEAHDLTSISAALQQIFNFLHLQRIAADVDRFGQGRYPLYIEPTTIILLTDGTELTSTSGVLQSIVPSEPIPIGGELASQPYRWDQRVYATVLRMPSVTSAVLERSGPLPQNGPISGSQGAVAMDNNISAFCESTGGKCYVATSWKVLLQHIEVTAARLCPCVVVSFEHLPVPGSPAPPPQVHAAYQRKLLYIRANQQHSQGHWPIPEAFWPDPAQQNWYPRDAHPVIAYRAVEADPSIPANFPCDKYEVESNPISGFLMNAPMGASWQVFIRNSKGPNHGFGDPFGYLKLDRPGSTLTLYVLPYNYPVLFQVLGQAGKMPGATKCSHLPQWRQEFERYCSSIPPYYGPPLRIALRQWGINGHVIPDSMEKALTFIINNLKRLKTQAKAELDALTEKQCNSINATSSLLNSPARLLPSLPNTEVQVNSNAARSVGQGEVSSRKGVDCALPSGPSKPIATSAKTGFAMELAKCTGEGASIGFFKGNAVFKNPFDIGRDKLLSQLNYLRVRVGMALEARSARSGEKVANLTKPVSCLAAQLAAKEEEEARHSLPIEKMGDFSDAICKQQLPRNPFAEDQDRSKQQRLMFGNPYRQEKNDGADEAWMEGSGGGAPSRGRKRRRRSEPTSPANSAGNATSSEGSVNNAEVNASEDSALSGTIPADIRRKNNSRAQGLLPMLEYSQGEQWIKSSGLDTVSSISADGSSNDGGTEVSMVESCIPSETVCVDASSAIPVVRNEQKLLYVAPSSQKEIRDAAELVVKILKALRYAKPGSTQELLELLAASDFPVGKVNFVEQLIIQAHDYKKLAVAKELIEYRNQIISKLDDKLSIQSVV